MFQMQDRFSGLAFADCRKNLFDSLKSGNVSVFLTFLNSALLLPAQKAASADIRQAGRGDALTDTAAVFVRNMQRHARGKLR